VWPTAGGSQVTSYPSMNVLKDLAIEHTIPEYSITNIICSGVIKYDCTPSTSLGEQLMSSIKFRFVFY
jgi:hypothetical protein